MLRKLSSHKFIAISIMALLLWIAGTMLDASLLHQRYPEIRLEGTELYGQNNENLKDLELTDDVLYSISDDPWITAVLDRPVEIKVIEIDQQGISDTDCEGQVFDTDTWYSITYVVHNGRTLLWYDNRTPAQSLRFDLVGTQQTSLQIDSIAINSAYGITCYSAWRVGILALFGWGLGCGVLYACDAYVGREGRIHQVLVWASSILLIVTCALVEYSIAQSNDMILHIWMSVAAVSLLFLTISSVAADETRYNLGIIAVPLYIVLHIAILEMLSGVPYILLPDNYTDGIMNLYFLSIALVLWCMLLGTMRRSMTLVSVIVGLLALVDHYYYAFRGKPIQLIDCMLAGTAADIIGSYQLELDLCVQLYITLELGLMCCLMIIPSQKRMTVRGYAYAVLYTVIGVCIGFLYSPEVSYWSPAETTQSIGYLSAFVAYAKQDLIIDKPSGYSNDAVVGILNLYKNDSYSTDEESVDVIVLMNESFSDLPDVYQFETNTAVMPFIDSLEENTVKGNLLVSVCGGGTADTEWEFLTGNSMAFSGGGGVPYVQYVKSDQESLASELADDGYETIAFHPCTRTNYERDVVYPYLGFDQYYSIENDLVSKGILRSYTSDDADVIDLINIYEQNVGDQPQFIFNVTIQNHGGYNNIESSIDVTVYPTNDDLQYSQLYEYLSLIRESDRAFEKLVNYYATQERKVVILMFGDHQPGVDEEVSNALDTHLASQGVDISSGQQRYTVPFIIWANYDIEEEDDVLISPGYLRAYLLNKAGLGLGSYDRFLVECRESYPAINSMGYYDADQQWHTWGELTDADTLLQEYSILQYGKVFDRKTDKARY